MLFFTGGRPGASLPIVFLRNCTPACYVLTVGRFTIPQSLRRWFRRRFFVCCWCALGAAVISSFAPLFFCHFSFSFFLLPQNYSFSRFCLFVLRVFYFIIIVDTLSGTSTTWAAVWESARARRYWTVDAASAALTATSPSSPARISRESPSTSTR